MERERAFNVVEQEVIESGDKYMLVAWKSMRKALVEGQKPTTDTGSPKFQWNTEEPSCGCGGLVKVVQVKYRCDCGKVFRML